MGWWVRGRTFLLSLGGIKGKCDAGYRLAGGALEPSPSGESERGETGRKSDLERCVVLGSGTWRNELAWWDATCWLRAGFRKGASEAAGTWRVGVVM